MVDKLNDFDKHGIDVAFKRKGLWYTAWLKEGTFQFIRQAKKRSDIKNMEDYITLKKFLKGFNFSWNNITGGISDIDLFVKDLLKKLDVETIHFLELPKKKKSWNAYWWSEKNPMCLKCVSACKQSKYVEVICNNFREG